MKRKLFNGLVGIVLMFALTFGTILVASQSRIVSGAEETETAAEDFSALSASYVEPFVDVSTDAWYASYVETACSYEGLISGTDATHFKPASNLTYAQAITFAARVNQYYYDGEITLSNGTGTEA